MKTPFLHGSIDRTLQLNYRIEPGVLEGLLPPDVRPYCLRGWAIGGVVLMRMAEVRPRFLPPWMGMQSEHALHWLAVLRDCDGPETRAPLRATTEGCERAGAYILRRDTDSRLSALAGGGLFRGDHHHASFAYRETPTEVEAMMVSDDGAAQVGVLAGVSGRLPSDSVFSDASSAMELLHPSATPIEGLEFARRAGDCEALCTRYLRASFFEDELRFPRGTVQFDSAVLGRGLQRLVAPVANGAPLVEAQA